MIFQMLQNFYFRYHLQTIPVFLLRAMNMIKMTEILNKEMKKIDTWLEYNGLVINTDKTHYMVFHIAKFKSISKDIYIFGILKLNVLQVLNF